MCIRDSRKDVSVLEKVDATSIGMRPSVGGAFLVNRVAYLRAGGDVYKRQAHDTQLFFTVETNLCYT